MRRSPGLVRAVLALVSLKWHLLLGGLRGSGQQRVQTIVAAAVATLGGALTALVLASVGNGSGSADDIVPVVLLVAVALLGLLSAATGVESTIDPRKLAGEPLTPLELAAGLLAAAAVGPGACFAVLAGIGLLLGWAGGGVVGWLIAVLVVLCWWATLVLVSRTAANLLGAVASGRYRQVAQAVATGAALAAWLVTQIVARFTGDWDSERWSSLSDVAAWTPPGQLGLALAAVDRPGTAAVHLLLGVSWLPLLVWVSVASTQRLTYSSPRPGPDRSARGAQPAGMRTGLRGLLPAGPAGAFAVRTLTTKLRTPRQAVNTVTALVIGAGVFLIGPLIDGGSPDPRMVLVGGVLHFAVLFDGNNGFGMDGPPLWMEVASGADARVLVRGKAMASLSVMALPAVLLPTGLAALSGGWEWLPAAWAIAAGSLLAATGVSVASASLAPVALPDSPNPLASGDTGQGCVAGLVLTAGMVVLVLVSMPVAIPVALLSDRSTLLATLVAAAAPLVGVGVLAGGAAIARTRLARAEAELVQKVTPAR